MLREEQAAELLRRCETIVGHRLEQIRGNLRVPDTRSAAVWELLVLEQCARLGSVEYEPEHSGTPDIRLTLPNGEILWIEIAFLYPRFWRQERRSQAVCKWLIAEARRCNIDPVKLVCHFEGDRLNPAGPVRCLPELHERKKFLLDREINEFFKRIIETPAASLRFKHSYYSLLLAYNPNATGPYIGMGGGLVQESAQDIREHAVYRVLLNKAKQHKVDGVHLVCIGSDQSPALSRLTPPRRKSPEMAIHAAFQRTRSLSGALVVTIEDSMSLIPKRRRIARTTLFLNDRATISPSEHAQTLLRQLNFNQWNYYFSLEKTEQPNMDNFKKTSGKLSIRDLGPHVALEVPAPTMLNCLIGKSNLIEEYKLDKDDTIVKCLETGWKIVSISLKDGDIEGDIPVILILELAPPHDPVYWPSKGV